MSKWSDLKQAAESATPGPWAWDQAGNLTAPSLEDPSAVIRYECYEGMWFGDYSLESCDEANKQWISKANPTVVLDLIAENERLQATCDGLDSQNDALAAENESLRKDAERYQFLKNLPDDQYLIERLECATDPENWDAAIDRAMAKEQKD